MNQDTSQNQRTLNERFRILRILNEFNANSSYDPNYKDYVATSQDTPEGENRIPELNLDTVLPPRPLIDEDNFDDDHVEIFDKQVLEDELNEIEKDIYLYKLYCK